MWPETLLQQPMSVVEYFVPAIDDGGPMAIDSTLVIDVGGLVAKDTISQSVLEVR